LSALSHQNGFFHQRAFLVAGVSLAVSQRIVPNVDDLISQLSRESGRTYTTTAHGRLMLTVLGGLAEFERELIRTRTGEGRQRAKARGVIMGRRPKLTGHQRREAMARREAGEVLTDIARSYNVSHSTISRLR
jgi:DNA invertase Pin-like site-specific DNA recombinase